MIKDNKVWILWTSMTDKLSNLPAPDLNLFARLYLAKIFFMSGRTKDIAPDGDGLWEGFVASITPSETTIMLFEEEYAVPLLSPEFAAQIALLAETFLPILLILGLATRLSAMSLLAMTAVIQLFVYPALWHEHMLWAAALILLVFRGGGSLSVDQWLVKKNSVKRV